MVNVVLYFHTLRYLRPVQIYGLIWHRLYRPRPDLRPPPPLRKPSGPWRSPARKSPSLIAPHRVRFLNEEQDILSANDWNHPAREKLWLYNLHYFDDLNADNARERYDWHRALIERWIADNPPGTGNGWEPYPLSLRIVNWIKWALAGNKLGPEEHHSLAVQVRYLARRMEYHLLGNHLFANAKALVFAGVFFEGSEADRWLRQGMTILQREIPEQILPDGGHFERSPLYHSIILEDVLDLANLVNVFPTAFTPWHAITADWPGLLGPMCRWLAVMCHPDGQISFFNDAAMGIAAAPDELFDYARRLEIMPDDVTDGVVWLRDSGYIRVQRDGAVLLIDVAHIGPDYLPGHAHADTLSYEFSLAGQRVVVNSGTSRYGLGPEREWQRGTAAHNTVMINDENSSEVWAGFRVARRARPCAVTVREEGDRVVVEAAHDGYRRLKGRPIHRRRWELSPGRLSVQDRVDGRFSTAVSRVHLHPDIEFHRTAADKAANQGFFRWHRDQARTVRWWTDNEAPVVELSDWHPAFGLSVPNKCLAFPVSEERGASVCRFTMEWG